MLITGSPAPCAGDIGPMGCTYNWKRVAMLKSMAVRIEAAQEEWSPIDDGLGGTSKMWHSMRNDFWSQGWQDRFGSAGDPSSPKFGNDAFGKWAAAAYNILRNALKAQLALRGIPWDPSVATPGEKAPAGDKPPVPVVYEVEEDLWLSEPGIGPANPNGPTWMGKSAQQWWTSHYWKDGPPYVTRTNHVAPGSYYSTFDGFTKAGVPGGTGTWQKLLDNPGGYPVMTVDQQAGAIFNLLLTVVNKPWQWHGGAVLAGYGAAFNDFVAVWTTHLNRVRGLPDDNGLPWEGGTVAYADHGQLEDVDSLPWGKLVSGEETDFEMEADGLDPSESMDQDVKDEIEEKQKAKALKKSGGIGLALGALIAAKMMF